MRVLSVVGITGSGKTTTVEHIVAELKRRRYSVGSVKDIHFEQFAIDTPGTNTDRHRRAGAGLVTARGLGETDILFPRRLAIAEILAIYSHDWVVLEGTDDCNCPEIICGHDENGLQKQLGPKSLAVAGVAANSISGDFRGLPVFNAPKQARELVDFLEQRVPRLLPDFSQECCGLCGMSCRDLLAAILRGEKTRADCILEQKVELSIGGREIQLVPFVQEVLARTITGLVSTLDGYHSHKKIQIKLSEAEIPPHK